MPNWVFNTLTVEGSPELVNELKKQVSAPYTMPVQSFGDLSFKVEDKEINQDFSFWNIIRPINMDVYHEQPVRSELPSSDPNWWADTVKVSATDDSWYNWNNRNWGCKWDASESELLDESENGENLVLVYRFDTPWSPPVPAMEKLSEQYPTLLLTLEYEEEQGWGGEIELHHGEVSAHAEWDSKCYACDATDTIDYCENDCGQFCSSCNHGNWVDEKGNGRMSDPHGIIGNYRKGGSMTVDELMQKVYDENFSHFDFMDNMNGGDCDCKLHNAMDLMYEYGGGLC